MVVGHTHLLTWEYIVTMTTVHWSNYNTILQQWIHIRKSTTTYNYFYLAYSKLVLRLRVLVITIYISSKYLTHQKFSKHDYTQVLLDNLISEVIHNVDNTIKTKVKYNLYKKNKEKSARITWFLFLIYMLNFDKPEKNTNINNVLQRWYNMEQCCASDFLMLEPSKMIFLYKMISGHGQKIGWGYVTLLSK